MKSELTIEEGDACGTCKSFSVRKKYLVNGFCMKQKKPKKRTDICGHYQPDVKIEFERECKPNYRTKPPTLRFSN